MVVAAAVKCNPVMQQFQEMEDLIDQQKRLVSQCRELLKSCSCTGDKKERHLRMLRQAVNGPLSDEKILKEEMAKQAAVHEGLRQLYMTDVDTADTLHALGMTVRRSNTGVFVTTKGFVCFCS